MAFTDDHEVLFGRLDEELRQAAQPGAALFGKIIASACTRIPLLNKSGKAGQIDRLIEAGAWAEAAMAMIELELPAWTLRRLIYEDGEWHCALSRRPNLPVELDDTVDASHARMPLAILRAFVEARQRNESIGSTRSIGPQRGPVPAVGAAQADVLCCDNFS